MDWLEDRQDAIEADLARRHLAPGPNPSRMALFEILAAAAQAQRDASLAALRNPAPGQPVTITNLNRPGIDRGSQPTDGGSYGSTKEVSG
jgi:hypothetical protein